MIVLLSVIFKVVLLEKLVVGQLVKIFPSFYENLTFIIFARNLDSGPYTKLTESK
jgi:hypothetical protein